MKPKSPPPSAPAAENSLTVAGLDWPLAAVGLILPFMFHPGLYEASDLPKSIFIQAVALAGFVFWSGRAALRQRLELGPAGWLGGFRLPGLMLLAWLALSTTWALAPFLVGPLLAPYTACLVWAFILPRLLSGPGGARLLLGGFFLSGVLVSVLGLLQAGTGLNWIPQAEPPAATFVNRNAATEYVAAVMPSGLALLGFGPFSIAALPARLLVQLGMVFGLGFVLVAAGRAALLAVLLGLLTAGLVFWRALPAGTESAESDETTAADRRRRTWLKLALIPAAIALLLGAGGGKIGQRFLAEWRTWQELTAPVDQGEPVTPAEARSALAEAWRFERKEVYHGSVVVKDRGRWYAVPAAYALYLEPDEVARQIPNYWRRILAHPDQNRLYALAVAAEDRWLRWGGASQPRLPVWLNTLALIGDHDWQGVGLDNFQVVYPLYKNAWALDLVSRDKVFRRTHNDYLQLAAEAGAIGGVLLLWLIVAVARSARAAARRATDPQAAASIAAVAGGLVALAVAAMFGFPFRLTAAPFLAASFAALFEILREGPQPPAGRAMPSAALAAGGLVLAGVLAGAALIPGWEGDLTADWHYRRAAAAEQAGDFATVRTQARKFLQLHPGDARGRVLLGHALIQNNDFADAAAELEKASACFPYYAHVWHNLGFAYFRCGRTKEACAAFSREVLLLPTAGRVHHDLGVLLGLEGRTDRAEAALRLATRYEAKVPLYHRSLARLLAKLPGGAAEAQQELARAAELEAAAGQK